MIREVKINNNFKLIRAHSKIGEIITWHIVNKSQSYGTIARMNNPWYYLRFGHKQFKIKYWIGYTDVGVVTANSRRDVIIQVLTLKGVITS